jgi:sugar lactone lactonase YvrE
MFNRQAGGQRGWRRIFSSPWTSLGVSLALLLTAASFGPLVAGFAQGSGAVFVVTTVAGGGLGSNALARQAPMELPTGVVFDPLGRGLYLIDEVDGTSLLRFVNTSPNAVTLAETMVLPGHINLIAGGGALAEDDVPARDADLAKVTGFAVDPSGQAVLLAIPAFNAIRVVNVGVQSYALAGRTFAAGTVGTLATPDFADLRGLVLQPATREVYFIAGPVVYRINGAGLITPFAGGGAPASGNGDGGPAGQARLVNPRALAFDANNALLIAEGGSPRAETPDGAVRRVNGNNTIASVARELEFPVGVAAAPNGTVYVALGNTQQLLSVAPNGTVHRVAGTSSGQACNRNLNPICGDGGPASDAALNLPDSAANETLVLAAENRGVYLPDYRYGRVRFINLSGANASILGTAISPQQINTVVGSGVAAPYDGLPATNAKLSEPSGIAVDAAGNLYIADTRTNRLRFVNRGTQPLTLFITSPAAVTVQPGQIVTLNKEAGEPQLDDRITTATFSSPQGLLATDKGLFIVDSQAGALIKVPPNAVLGRRSGVLRFLNTSNQPVTFFPNGGDARVIVPPGEIKDIAGARPPANPQELGDGLSANRVAFFPTDVALDSAGNLYLTDQANHRIRRIEPSEGVVRTVYGDGLTTTLNRPAGIAFDASGRLLIADTRNNRILRQQAAGSTSFAVIADESQNVKTPRDLAAEASGKIFVVNAGTHQVLEVDAPGQQLGNVRVVAGNGSAGYSGDGGPAVQARLNYPPVGTTNNDIQLTANIVVLSNGDLLFTDSGNQRVRQLRSAAPLAVASLSAASYSGAEFAGESIVAAFGAT